MYITPLIYKTINQILLQPVHGVTCGAPGPVPDGDIVGSVKSVYNVGEVVTYTCTDADITSTQTRKCLTTGEWSSLNYACTGEIRYS